MRKTAVAATMYKVNVTAILLSLLIGVVIFPSSLSFSLKGRRANIPTATTILQSATTPNDSNDLICWNPAQASEFLTWHAEDPEKAGQQLAPMIQHWVGTDVGEFLTRMYLGTTDDFTISYHPSNVRNPQWLGLGEDGLRYLTLFFLKALPPTTLLPVEMTRFANYFLLKEHKWPTDATNKETTFETDSFRPYAADLARVLGYVRRERLGELTADDVIALLPKEEEDKNRLLSQLGEFFGNFGMKLTSMEKIVTVEGLALQGCAPGLIARLISSIEEITEEARIASLERTKSLPEVQGLLEKKASVGDPISSSPVKTPISEIISRESESLGLLDFESRWLPEELLQEDQVQ